MIDFNFVCFCVIFINYVEKVYGFVWGFVVIGLKFFCNKILNRIMYFFNVIGGNGIEIYKIRIY